MESNALGRFVRGPGPWLIAAVVAFALYFANPWGEDVPEDPRPIGGVEAFEALRERDDVNVLFILVDTLRADRLRTYGYTRPTSPFFDAIAYQGVRFDRHLSQSSWTKCSMASLWTGYHPTRAGVTRFDHTIPEQAKMPAEIFREAGFRTAGIWRNGWVEGYFGFDQGFEIYTRPNFKPVASDVRRENPTVTHGGTDVDVVEGAVEFLRAYGRERWFLYLHLMDLHEFVYDSDSAKFGTGNADIYDNSILRVNYILDQLFGHLYEAGQLDKTLIVIGSDHGEAFGERGFEGHARTVYPETTEVPLIFGLPFRLQPGLVVKQRTENVDIWPTILDMLGLPALEDTDGRSRVPEMLAELRSETPPADETVAVAHLDQTWGQRVDTISPTVSVSEKGFRYVMVRGPKGNTVEELFDADQDRRELQNVAEENPEVTARLRDEAERYLEREPPWKDDAPTLELDEIQLNQLRALGYSLP
ncbi:MAG: sulfatase [Myxococcota bacterium]